MTVGNVLDAARHLYSEVFLERRFVLDSRSRLKLFTAAMVSALASSERDLVLQQALAAGYKVTNLSDDMSPIRAHFPGKDYGIPCDSEKAAQEELIQHYRIANPSRFVVFVGHGDVDAVGIETVQGSFDTIEQCTAFLNSCEIEWAQVLDRQTWSIVHEV
jgi:hypothetical protein